MTRSALTMFALSGALLLGGCAANNARIAEKAGASVVIEDEAAWRSVATQADAARLDGLKASWTAALANIRGGTREHAALLDPESALAVPAPPPGHYRCRVVRVAAKGARVTAYKPFSCHIGNDGARLNFTKEGGSERPAGWIWSDDETRLIFLGTMVQGRERTTPAYGEGQKRNIAGVIERIAPFRWRMVLPAPVSDSRLDVIELVPLVPGAEG